MEVHYEGKTYTFDLEDITLGQATQIKRKAGLSLLKLEQGIGEADPDAIRCIYWLMLVQSGEKVNFDNIDFKIVKFSNAVQEAYEKEQAEKGEETPNQDAA